MHGDDLEYYMMMANRARNEVHVLNKLLDELCEVVTDEASRAARLHDIDALLRERHASWEGWK